MSDVARFGFHEITGILPRMELGRPLQNAKHIEKAARAADTRGSCIIATAELALTGYTCEDLFHSETLIADCEKAMAALIAANKTARGVWIIGAPLRLRDGRLLNVAWVLFQGRVLGVVPKTSLPNMGEFYERRWFVSGRGIHQTIHHAILGEFLVSDQLIFETPTFRFGIEICHDLWSPIQPSVSKALQGAQLIINLSASNEVLGKAEYRRRMIEVQSKRLHCAYLYVSAGHDESSKDTVFSGHGLLYESGRQLAEIKPFSCDETVSATVDFERIQNLRMKDVCFLEEIKTDALATVISVPMGNSESKNFNRSVDPHPFLSEVTNFDDVMQIQAQGLYRRAVASKAKTLIVGISGGLDSTHALHVAHLTRELSVRYKSLNDKTNPLKILGVTMPGPGTSEKTLNLARTLLKEVGVDEVKEISITTSVTQHLSDLGRTGDDTSVVFENAQARERTQILFDLANECSGLVVGTGDLSELALGWCTFNADHMAHYAVNSGIPKTVIKALIQHWSEQVSSAVLKSTLQNILELPISPELLSPQASGEIAQETENVIGPYALHDFFLYQVLNDGYSKEKTRFLAGHAFAHDPVLLSRIDATLEIFYKRFYSQQFKRSTLPPGPKVHAVSLSPRSDFRMPDEL